MSNTAILNSASQLTSKPETTKTNSARGIAFLGALSLGCGSCLLSASPAGAFTFNTLVEFDRSAAVPQSGLVIGVDGTVYGGTSFNLTSFSSNQGTLFSYNPSTGFNTLVQFQNNGYGPTGQLAIGADGTVYGTTPGLPMFVPGTLFSYKPGVGLTTLSTFSTLNQLYYPSGVVIGLDGNLYGSAYSLDPSLGFGPRGSLFSYTPGTGQLQMFNLGVPDPGISNVPAIVSLVVGSDGTIYGITPGTSAPGTSTNGGTLFSFRPGVGFTTLATFNGTNGSNPAGLAIAPNGTLYGTTYIGGSNGLGTLFSYATSTGLSTLVNFGGANGSTPRRIVIGPNGTIYGITGSFPNPGTVFSYRPGAGLTTLVDFTGTNLFDPFGGLAIAPNGTLYGTTRRGGSNYGGVLFSITGLNSESSRSVPEPSTALGLGLVFGVGTLLKRKPSKAVKSS